MSFKPKKLAVNRRRKDVGAPSLPKTSHAKATTVPKHTHRIKNLGKYAHPAKLPTGAKIGADVVKMKKPRKSKRGAY